MRAGLRTAHGTDGRTGRNPISRRPRRYSRSCRLAPPRGSRRGRDSSGDHQVPVRRNPEVLVEDIAQCALGHSRGATQIFGIDLLITHRPHQAQRTVEDLCSTNRRTTDGPVGFHGQERAQGRVEDFRPRRVLDRRAAQPARTLHIRPEQPLRQANQLGNRLARGPHEVAIQQHEVPLVFVRCQPRHQELFRDGDGQPACRLPRVDMKHAPGGQPRDRLPVEAMAVDEQLIVAGQGNEKAEEAR